jgi:hypothetical protein
MPLMVALTAFAWWESEFVSIAMEIVAVEQEATLNALAVEAENDLLKKHFKRAAVDIPLLVDP